MELPEEFRERMPLVFGEAGSLWVERFPDLLAACIDRWGLGAVTPVADLSMNFVAHASRPDGTVVYIKIGVPNREFESEAEMLRIMDGDGYVRLIEYDEELSAMLLERADPGTPLAEIDDDEEATTIAARLLTAATKRPPANHTLPSVAGWAAGLARLRPHFGGGTGPFPSRHVFMAEEYFRELLEGDTEPDVLIHGDFHHWNILKSRRLPWLIIDPKGLVGPLGYEIGQFIHNFPAGRPDAPFLGEVIARRIDIFSRILGLPRRRLFRWGFAQTILSAWWCIEDGGDCCPSTLECACAMEPYLV